MKAFLPVFLLLCGCKKIYTTEECEHLSMKAYRGLPKEAALWKKHCRQKTLHYTQELCQKAFKDLVLKGSTDALEKKYGALVLECFNRREKERFLLKTPKN